MVTRANGEAVHECRATNPADTSKQGTGSGRLCSLAGRVTAGPTVRRATNPAYTNEFFLGKSGKSHTRIRAVRGV